jgi:hypothetical protein
MNVRPVADLQALRGAVPLGATWRADADDGCPTGFAVLRERRRGHRLVGDRCGPPGDIAELPGVTAATVRRDRGRCMRCSAWNVVVRAAGFRRVASGASETFRVVVS